LGPDHAAHVVHDPVRRATRSPVRRRRGPGRRRRAAAGNHALGHARVHDPRLQRDARDVRRSVDGGETRMELCPTCGFAAGDYDQRDAMGTLRALAPIWRTMTEDLDASALDAVLPHAAA